MSRRNQHQQAAGCTLHREWSRLAEPETSAVIGELLADATAPVFVWSDSTRGLHIYGAGIAAAGEASGEDALKMLRCWCRNTGLEQASSPGPQHMPLWVGSFACLPGVRRLQSSVWRGWPDGRLWAPAKLVVVEGGEAWLIETSTPDGTPRLYRGNPQQPRASHLSIAETTGHRPAALGDAETPGAGYRSLVASAVQDVVNKDGEWRDLSKVVVARSATATRSEVPVDLSGLLAAARAAQPTAIQTIVHWPGAGTCVSATPERLVGLETNQVRSEALAGTAKLDEGSGLDAISAQLLGSEKDRAEHASTADHLRNVFAARCDNVVMPAEPNIKRLKSLIHLHTPISGRLRRKTHILELVEAIHPTPAIVGSPAAAARDWLDRHEGMDRGHYAGPVGWFDQHGAGDFAVALRCALVRPDAVHVFAGAGIVDGSVPDGEWAETEAKLASARAFVAAAAVSE